VRGLALALVCTRADRTSDRVARASHTYDARIRMHIHMSTRNVCPSLSDDPLLHAFVLYRCYSRCALTISPFSSMSRRRDKNWNARNILSLEFYMPLLQCKQENIHSASFCKITIIKTRNKVIATCIFVIFCNLQKIIGYSCKKVLMKDIIILIENELNILSIW